MTTKNNNKGALNMNINEIKDYLNKHHFDTTQKINVTSIESIQEHKGHIVLKGVQINKPNELKDNIFLFIKDNKIVYSQGSLSYETIEQSLEHFMTKDHKYYY